MTRATLPCLLALAACGPQMPADAQASATAPVAALAPLLAPSTPDTPSIRIVELAIDAKLTPAERVAMAEAQARDRAKDAAEDAREDAALKATLARYAKLDSAGQAALRHQLRAGLHFAEGNDPAVHRILAKRDPVLVEDVKARDLVTQADMRAIDSTNRYVARLAGVSAPDMTEEPGERAKLRQVYATNASLRTVLTQARQRNALFVSTMDKLPAAKRAEIAKSLQAQVKTPKDVVQAARGAETLFADAAKRPARQAGGSSEWALLQKRIRQQHEITRYSVEMNGILDAVDATD